MGRRPVQLPWPSCLLVTILLTCEAGSVTYTVPICDYSIWILTSLEGKSHMFDENWGFTLYQPGNSWDRSSCTRVCLTKVLPWSSLRLLQYIWIMANGPGILPRGGWLVRFRQPSASWQHLRLSMWAISWREPGCGTVSLEICQRLHLSQKVWNICMNSSCHLNFPIHHGAHDTSNCRN